VDQPASGAVLSHVEASQVVLQAVHVLVQPLVQVVKVSSHVFLQGVLPQPLMQLTCVDVQVS